VEATWGIYQRMVAAYREPDRTRGRELMQKLIDTVSDGVPAALTEVITLGRTLAKRAADVLASFDRPGTSNGPTEAINGRLEHLRGSASGSATSPTTSPGACSKPAGSDRNYTLNSEEPGKGDGELGAGIDRVGQVDADVRGAEPLVGVAFEQDRPDGVGRLGARGERGVLLGDRTRAQATVGLCGAQRDRAVAVFEVAREDAIGLAVEHAAAEPEGVVMGLNDPVAHGSCGLWGRRCMGGQVMVLTPIWTTPVPCPSCASSGAFVSPGS
jgi:hypothetical protein